MDLLALKLMALPSTIRENMSGTVPKPNMNISKAPLKACAVAAADASAK